MIYVVEDEASIRKLVVYTLETAGFEAKGFVSGADLWPALRAQPPQLVLLDIMLPGEDGLEILKKLRAAKQTNQLPVMLLTAKGSEFDKVLGLETGADDYLPKPFGMMELVARVKNILRRTRSQVKTPEEEYQVGSLFVSVPRHLVTVEGSPVVLTLKEFDLLLYLLRNPGIVLTRDQIMNGVWGYDFDGESRTVNVHIRTLRAKLGACADVIETVRGVGYRAGGGA